MTPSGIEHATFRLYIAVPQPTDRHTRVTLNNPFRISEAKIVQMT